ncbi:MAG: penicillin-binding protein 1A, partial [Ectothiorhodospiraceae bacterium]
MKRLSRIIAYLLASFLGLGLLGLGGAGVAYLVLAPDLPPVESLKDVEFQVPLRVLSADGVLIAEYGEKKRAPIHYDEAPQDLVNAFIAAEDQRFFEHPGVDYQGILRAIWYLVRTGEKGPGGSTITMQVARNFFLTRERTFLRKGREILLALKIDRELSKQEILELYMNKIYLGHRAYGVGAAAQVYYGKPLGELTLAQLAMIAGLPKAPSAFNPVTDPKRALVRRGYVLGRMHDLGFISDARFRKAMSADITARLHGGQSELDAPYVAEMVRTRMVQRFGEEAAYTDGYTVYTTVDSSRQKAAGTALREALHEYDERHGYRGPLAHVELTGKEGPDRWAEALKDQVNAGGLTTALVVSVDDKGAELFDRQRAEKWRLPWDGIKWARPYVSRNAQGKAPAKPADVLSPGDIIRVRTTDDGPRLAQVPQVEGAIVSIAPQDGHIIALVGGYAYDQSKFNRVLQARRQPGSSFKPFIYSAALANGFTPATLVNDAPVVFRDEALESTWRPQNYSGKFFGPTRLRQALIHSRNLVSIRVLRSVGVDTAIEYLTRFGFQPDQLPRNLSLALGSASVTPLQLVRGYAVFANGGHRVEPYYIDRVVNDDDEVVYESDPVRVCADCESTDKATEADKAKTADGQAAAVTAAAAGDDAGGGPRVAPRVISADNAYLMTTMMRDVIRHGTGRKALRLGRHDLAGKTGTTNDQRDAWFAGFNQDLVTAAW